MHVRAMAVAACAALALAAGCAGVFGHEYEYEEQLYLSVDGSASVVVDASVAALVALRGVAVDPSSRAPFDPVQFRRLYESSGCHVTRVGQPWYRHGRRFIQIRLETTDVRTFNTCTPLAWSTYRFNRANGVIEFRQNVGSSAGGDPGSANWIGDELVAFKVHVPSRIAFHNVRRLTDNSTGEAERGNILTWEQRLTDRRANVAVDVQVTMEPESILYRTLWMFGGSFVAAVVVLAGLIWWTVRKGRKRARAMRQ